jgi:hypothetical protein
MTTAHHVGFIIGPSIGGLMIDYLSWRWSFFFLVPIGICGMLLTLLNVKQRPLVFPSRSASIDYLGAALLFATTSALVMLLDRRTQQMIPVSLKVALAVLFIVCLVGLILHETKASNPILNLRLFRIRRFSMSVTSLLVVASCYSLTGFLLPFYLQDVLGLTATSVGMLFMAASLITIALAPASGHLADRLGPRIPGTVGVAFMIVSLGMGGLLARRFALAPARLPGHCQRHHQRNFQSGQFYGNDRDDAGRASRFRIGGESRYFRFRECFGSRVEQFADVGSLWTSYGDLRNRSHDGKSLRVCSGSEYHVCYCRWLELGRGGHFSYRQRARIVASWAALIMGDSILLCRNDLDQDRLRVGAPAPRQQDAAKTTCDYQQ